MTGTTETYVLENDHARFEIEAGDGFELSQVTDVSSGTRLLEESPYFEGVPFSFRIQTETYTPTAYPCSELTVQSVTTDERDGHQLLDARLEAPGVDGFLATVEIDLPPDDSLAEWTIAVEGGDVDGLFTFPHLSVAVDGESPGWGMIPTEMGVSGPIGRSEGRIGLPNGLMNAMPFGAIGGGPDGPLLGVANLLPDSFDVHLQIDRDGRFRGNPRQFVTDAESADDVGDRVVLARALFGPVGRWQDAADVYRERTDAAPPATAPDWFREAGGLYGHDGGGGGSSFLYYPREESADWPDYDHGELSGHIDSFEDLPDLLEEAKAMGTNVLHLWDFWEDAGDLQIPYSNKGDYVPRSDLGGAEAFENGIDAVHEQGGRVVLYVEPFIAHYRSDVGLAHGEDWSIKGPTGEPQTDYHKRWTMCAAVEAWQDYVADVSARLVRDFDADGIHLDSYGLQWEERCYDSTHGHDLTGEAFNDGVIELVEGVRDAIREVKPDAVVVTESHNDRLAKTIDGSLDGSFSWPQYDHTPQPPLERSPLKYVYPHFQAFAGSLELSSMHQAFAAGQGFALAPYWREERAHLKALLDARREYADALVYGELGEEPGLSSSGAVAYRHVGDDHEVVVVTGATDDAWAGDLSLGSSGNGTRWTDALSGEVYDADESGTVGIQVGDGEDGIAVLVATR